MGDSSPAGTAPTGSGTSGVVEGEASAGVGSAPGSGVDAPSSAQAVEGSPAAVAGAYRILNREFRDQKHAEEVLGSEIGAKRGLQKQNADLQKQLQALQAQVETLRTGGSAAQVQGSVPGSNGESLSFADELAKSGELELFAKIAQDESMGPGHMAYAMAQAFDKHFETKLNKAIEDVRSGITQITSQGQFEKTLARTMTAAKSLTSEFPELDDTNQSEEAEQARESVLELLQSTPQVNTKDGPVPHGVLWLANDPASALRWAATEVRRQHGTPVFAQAPGSSGSPSTRAAVAAERSAMASAATPLDGSGVPRQKQSGEPETLADKWRADRQKARREARTPSGRSLGFTEGGPV